MSPLTLYSPALPILHQGGGAGAREVGTGSSVSTSKSSSGLHSDLFTAPVHDGQSNPSIRTPCI